MFDATDYTNNQTFSMGNRVQLHPGTDQAAMGDRYGEVVETRIRKGTEFFEAQIKLDKSGSEVWCSFDQLRKV